MKRYLVVVPDFLKPPPDIEQAILGEATEIRLLGTSDEKDLLGQVENADALMVWDEISISASTIKRLENCKVIVRYGVGFDNIDINTAGRHGIYVCNIPDYGINDVADHAMALLLTLVRGIVSYNEAVRESVKNWNREINDNLHRLGESTLGIIGLGRIGTATALRAKAFGINVIFYDPYVSDGKGRTLGIKRVTFNELLKKSDFISFHAPLTDETQRMVDQEFFQNVKPGVIIINTARGKIVDLDALYKALKDGRVLAAGLDVLPQEPPDKNHPLIETWQKRESWIKNRLVITPHAASFCKEALNELRMKAAIEVKRVLDGKPPKNCVNKIR